MNKFLKTFLICELGFHLFFIVGFFLFPGEIIIGAEFVFAIISFILAMGSISD